jgi:S1-C subfamily serine protease
MLHSLKSDLVLQVDVDADKLRPALIGTSRGLRVGQSCFAIGNPLGYEHTLTTGVISPVKIFVFLIQYNFLNCLGKVF